jgi:hypothetical protein
MLTSLAERVMGIEPTLRAWEAPVLPLNYTRAFLSLYSIGFAENSKGGLQTLFYFVEAWLHPEA